MRYSQHWFSASSPNLQPQLLVGFLMGLYWVPLFLTLSIIVQNNINLYFFADNSQLYLPWKTGDSIQPSLDCFEVLVIK